MNKWEIDLSDFDWHDFNKLKNPIKLLFHIKNKQV